MVSGGNEYQNCTKRKLPVKYRDVPRGLVVSLFKFIEYYTSIVALIPSAFVVTSAEKACSAIYTRIEYFYCGETTQITFIEKGRDFPRQNSIGYLISVIIIHR